MLRDKRQKKSRVMEEKETWTRRKGANSDWPRQQRHGFSLRRRRRSLETNRHTHTHDAIDWRIDQLSPSAGSAAALLGS